MPSPEQGLASQGRDVVRPLVLDAWDVFIPLAEAADLSQSTRLPGWRGQEVVVHLGAWDEHIAMQGLIASARGHGPSTPPDPDDVNRRIVEQKKDASRDEVLLALRRNRDEVRRYFSDEPESTDLAPVMSTVGDLPLLSVVLGQCYELAVHALDLVECGAPEPPADLLQSGLAALTDITGALARRVGITSSVALWTPDGGWSFSTTRESWATERVTGARPRGTVVEGTATGVLDTSAGRTNPVGQLARRRLKVHGMGGLMRLAPIVESVPGIPGGPTLRVAARALSGAGGVVGRLSGR